MDNSTSIKSTVIPYGIFLGFILSLITIAAYAFNIDILTTVWMSVLKFILIIGFGIVAAYQAKKKCQGFSFKDAFTAIFIPIALGTLIYTIINYVLFSLVDPEAAHYLLTQGIKKAREVNESMGGSKEQLNKVIESMKNEDQYSLKNQFFGFISNLAFYSLITLIIAALVKGKKNNVV